MKTMKTFGIAGGLVAAALVGGTLISAVSAAPDSAPRAFGGPVTDESDVSEYCQLWQRTFAAELGVEAEALVPAAKTATIAVIEAAVEDGKIPADIGERMIAAVEGAEGNGCRLLGAGFHAFGRHAARVDWRHDWATAAAGALGMDVPAMVEALRSGDTLRQISQVQGVDYEVVSQAILDAAETNLDALVEAGRMTQEAADERLANLDQALQSNKFPPLPGPGHSGPRFGGGPFRGGTDAVSPSSSDAVSS